MMKRISILIAAIIAVAAFAGCSTGSDEAADSKIVVELGDNVVTASCLTVSATGSVSVMPDVAYVTVGVWTSNEDMQAAQDENAELMNAVFAALQASRPYRRRYADNELFRLSEL